MVPDGSMGPRIAIAGIAALLPVMAFGQEAGGSKLPDVLVTGSRVTLSIEESTGPIVVVSPADIQRSTADSIGKILQALPLQNGPTSNTNDNFGDGATRINLRGLGPERTLVLLNGRRFLYGGLGADNSVDVDMIPLSMIDRVEIFANGASAIYGSDAVAGVVNIITRRDYSGGKVAARYRRSEHGDGATPIADALYGFSSEHFKLVAGAEYVDQDGVLQGARDYSAHVESLASTHGPVVNTGSFITARGAYDVPPGNTLRLPPSPSIFYTRTPGSTGRAAQDFRLFDPSTDLFNYAPYTYLQTPSRRLAGWLSAEARLTDSIEAYAELLAHHRRSQQQFGPATYSSFNRGAALIDPATQQQYVPQDNFYNPFGVDLIGVFKVLSEAGPREYEQDVDTFRSLVGLRGALGAWHWDTSLTWARSDTEDREGGQILIKPVRQAVGPSGRDVQGNVVCGPPQPDTGTVLQADIISDCVPLDLFGPEGSITSEQLDYVVHSLRHTGSNQHWLANATVTREFGTLPAGRIRWAVGAEYREERGDFTLDSAFGEGVTGLLTFGVPEHSSFDARELFIEMRAPLARDLSAVRALDMTVGARHSRFSAFGNNTAVQGGLRWNVTRSVSVRGGYSEVFRAPGTSELFASQLEQTRPIRDPCGDDPSPEQQRNCVAAGVPGGSYVDPTPGTHVLFGGNPDLDAEHGNTWTAGIALDWRALHVSLDYWHVKLHDAISFPEPEQITFDCANTGQAESCGLISRFDDGSISEIDSRALNLSNQSVSGLDLAVSLSRKLSWGEIAVQVLGTYLQDAKFQQSPASPTVDVAGTYADFVAWPEQRIQATLDVRRNAWRVSYTAHYIDSLEECGDKDFLFGFLEPDDCRRIEDRLYHDVSAHLELGGGFSMQAGIENLADTDPPRINLSDSANTDPTTYPLLGRTWSVGFAFELH